MTTQRDSSTVRDRSTVIVSDRADNGTGIALAVIAVIALVVVLWWMAFGPGNNPSGGGSGGGGAVPSLSLPSNPLPSVEPSPASS